MDKPDVDLIEGLSPAIAIEQKATSHNPRSTVGTVTEIHDYLRLLYARAGTPYCPDHGIPLASQTVSQMVDAVLALPADTRLMVLAPVARERKGEFEELFAQMQAQGYVRFRIDGAIVEPDRLPKLKKNEKHDIDVVIDRLKVRPDAQQRLAESFEAALRLAEGRAVALEMDGGREHLFNARFACPVCHWSHRRAGAAPVLLQLAGGRLPGLRRPGLPGVLRPAAGGGLSRRCRWPPARSRAGTGATRTTSAWSRAWRGTTSSASTSPSRTWPRPVQQAVLQGTGEEEVRFNYVMESGASAGRKVTRKHPFEGVIPNMARRLRETDSPAVREELARYRSLQPCPECGGTRLRPEARHVRIGDGEQARTIHQVASATLREAQAWFEALALAGSKAEIAAKVVREIALRLKFLNDVGLNYLSLDRSAETLSGGEAQRIRLASQIGSGLTGVMYVLDEPSIGLHQRDNDRLIGTLQAPARPRQQRAGGGARRGHDPRRRPRGGHGAGRRHPRRPGDGPGHAAGRAGQPRVADRALPGRDADDPGAAPAPCLAAAAGRPAGPAAAAAHRRRARPQPQGRDGGLPGRAAHLRHRRVRLGQVHAGQRHAVCGGGAHAVPGAPGAGRARGDRRHRPLRQGDQRRPVADRPHAAQQPGHLHRPVHADPRADGRDCRPPRSAATAPAASPSTWPAAAARPARATAWSRSRCTSCPTSTCPATSATASATTARRWKCSGRAATSPRSWT